jgi:hypothetical protein
VGGRCSSYTMPLFYRQPEPALKNPLAPHEAPKKARAIQSKMIMTMDIRNEAKAVPAIVDLRYPLIVMPGVFIPLERRPSPRAGDL